jgi:membrane-associated phospholipid phosphatase
MKHTSRNASEAVASRALPWADRRYGARALRGGSFGALNCEAATGSRDAARVSTIVRARESVFAACGAFEWVTLLYLSIVNTLIVAFRANLPAASIYIVIHECIAAAILIICWSAAKWNDARLRFVRHWYALPLYIYFFEELRSLVHLIFPRWFDAFLIQFDYSIGHVDPSIWLTRFANPALNDFMQFSYMTYFIYLVALPAILYMRREFRAFWTVMTSTAVAHYSVYVISILFPVESPHFALAALQPHLTGGVSTALINFIESFGRVHGAAFPSAHVAGSMVAILASWRYRRWLFWLCLPFFACMMVATVYGGYHYVADVLAGTLTGAIGFAVGSRLVNRAGGLPRISETL